MEILPNIIILNTNNNDVKPKDMERFISIVEKFGNNNIKNKKNNIEGKYNSINVADEQLKNEIKQAFWNKILKQ